MIPRRHRPLAAVICGVAAVIGGVVVVATRGDGDGRSNEPAPTLGGARLIGGGGELPPPADIETLQDVRFRDFSPPMSVARRGCSGLWLLFPQSLQQIGDQGRLVDGETTGAPQGNDPGWMAINQRGEVAVTGVVSTAGIFDADMELIDQIRPPFDTISVSWSADGALLVSEWWYSDSEGTPHIAAVDRDGTVRYLLAPEGSGEEADFYFDHPVETTVVGLADGRIVFSTNVPPGRPGDGELYVIDGDQLTWLETPGWDTPIRRIFEGPDGKLLAFTGPHIALVDPDNGSVEVLIDLSEVRDELEPPVNPRPDHYNVRYNELVSPTYVGDDLVFIAQNRLWQLDGAFEREGPDPECS